MATQSQHQEKGPQSSIQSGAQQRLVNGLGWFSVGLGLAEIVAPGTLANLIGVKDGERTRKVFRMYGVRELAAGIGILSQANPSGWMWARVAGDLVDLSSLGKAMGSSRTERGKAGAATAAVLGVTALDLLCAQQLSRRSGPDKPAHSDSPQIAKSIIIERSAEEIYGFWRDFSRLPQLFKQLESVQVTDGNRSHWVLKAPLGRTIEWDAEVAEDEPNVRIAWRSISSPAQHSGSVRFERATGGRGTKVTVQMELGDFGGKLGKLLGAVPEEQVGIALHNLKQILETGEVVQSDASIHTGMHPGRPPEKYPAQAQSMQAAASM